MTTPNNLPDPYIPVSQWTQGEALDDLKMHRRTDEKFDELAGWLQGWSTQFASFFVRLTTAGALPGTSVNSIPFNDVRYDTASGWSPPGGGGSGAFYSIPWNGQYLCGTQLTQNSPASQMEAVLAFSDGTTFGGAQKASATGISSGVSLPRRLTAGTQVFVWSPFAYTPDVSAGFIGNYLFVQQIGW